MRCPFSDGPYHEFERSQIIAPGVRYVFAPVHTKGNSIIIAEDDGLFYMMHGDVTYCDAALKANKLSIIFEDKASAGVTQPADYNTATLKTWLSDSANAYAYAYADDLAADEGFIGLTVEGKSFIYNDVPSDTALSITVEPVACYALSSDESDWSADNLAWSDADSAYFATDTTQTSCFARLRFNWDW